mmetsp:Transcript_28316/g.67084  ORF Transcript_28316/g.67084 Transcript_28316/m.67084 type:complete len:346 (-) Transcript_28316:822-1859(-)
MVAEVGVGAEQRCRGGVLLVQPRVLLACLFHGLGELLNLVRHFQRAFGRIVARGSTPFGHVLPERFHRDHALSVAPASYVHALVKLHQVHRRDASLPERLGGTFLDSLLVDRKEDVAAVERHRRTLHLAKLLLRDGLVALLEDVAKDKQVEHGEVVRVGVVLEALREERQKEHHLVLVATLQQDTRGEIRHRSVCESPLLLPLDVEKLFVHAPLRGHRTSELSRLAHDRHLAPPPASSRAVRLRPGIVPLSTQHAKVAVDGVHDLRDDEHAEKEGDKRSAQHPVLEVLPVRVVLNDDARKAEREDREVDPAADHVDAFVVEGQHAEVEEADHDAKQEKYHRARHR